MKRTLIGSNAIKYWFPDFPREPKDIDYVGEGKNGDGIEYLPNPVLENYLSDILYPDDLYTLKVSHTVGWDINWDKHMYDQQWLKAKGCILNEHLFFKLYNYWSELHGNNKRSDLEMSADMFFNNAVKFPVYHDDIHKLLIKHPYFEGQVEPTYSMILKEGAEVEVSELKFNRLTEKQKYNLVFEEVAVMSIENRFDPKLGYKHLYHRMLKKFILNHAPLWEALWIVENYKHVLTTIPFNYKLYLNEQISGI